MQSTKINGVVRVAAEMIFSTIWSDAYRGAYCMWRLLIQLEVAICNTAQRGRRVESMPSMIGTNLIVENSHSKWGIAARPDIVEHIKCHKLHSYLE